jgi:Agenet domain
LIQEDVVMTQKTRQSHSDSTTAILPVVLFGVDQHGKPKAARFPESQARLAAKAANQLDLRVLTIDNMAVAELAATLPVGRIHASGKGFVPNVRGDLYAKLLAMAGAPTQVTQPSAQTPGQAPSNGGGANTKKPPQDRLPKDWDAIAPGHLVVAQETVEDGWYDAIVVEQNGDILTLRWRDYPRGRRYTRHYRTLALLCPTPHDPSAAKPFDKPAKQSAPRAAAPKHTPTAPGLPHSWAEIAVGQLVLSLQDGPWGAWWEAIVTEINGDTITLRWRDYADLPPITRPRASLALLCPSAP